MKYDCKFDKKRDIQASVPGLAIDLNKAIESGEVMSTGVVGEYNEIKSPSEIVGRADDQFEVFNAQRSIIASAKSAKKAAAAKAVEPASAPSPAPAPSE